MKKFIERISHGTSISPRRIQRLERVYKSGDSFEPVSGTVEHPPHLVAYGEARCGNQVDEVRTAVNVRVHQRREHDEIEYSTNVGQIPNNSLGAATVERLNHRLDGKCVTFGAERADRADVVYTSRTPADRSNRRRIRRELENHAKTKVVVKPILDRTLSYGDPDPRLGYSAIKGAAKEIVDSGLNLQNKLGRTSSVQYFPRPPRKSEGG